MAQDWEELPAAKLPAFRESAAKSAQMNSQLTECRSVARPPEDCRSGSQPATLRSSISIDVVHLKWCRTPEPLTTTLPSLSTRLGATQNRAKSMILKLHIAWLTAKATSAMTMPLKYRVDTGSDEAQKPAIGRIN
jgi:hypothetical protein